MKGTFLIVVRNKVVDGNGAQKGNNMRKEAGLELVLQTLTFVDYAYINTDSSL